jgi:hypothetical protein
MTREAPDRPGAPTKPLPSLRMLLLAVTALLVSLPAVPLIVTTSGPTLAIKSTSDQIERLRRGAQQRGPSMQAYDECVSKWVAQRTKGAPCDPGDSACVKEQQLPPCAKPAELQLIGKGDVAGALMAGPQVGGSLFAMLSQRRVAAVAEVSRSVFGYAASLALALLLAAAATLSGWSLRRASLDVEESDTTAEQHARVSAALLAGVAAVALAAAWAGLRQLELPGWDASELAWSLTTARVAAAVALLTAVVAGAGAWWAYGALVALQGDDDGDDEWEGKPDDDADDG